VSGGQIISVGDVWVLDKVPVLFGCNEQTAGHDQRGRRQIMDLFHPMHIQKGLTPVLVTHSMEDAARYADTVAIMHDGRCVVTGDPAEIFSNEEQLRDYRLEPPRTIRLQRKFEEKAGITLDTISLTEEALAKNIALALSEGRDSE